MCGIDATTFRVEEFLPHTQGGSSPAFASRLTGVFAIRGRFFVQGGSGGLPSLDVAAQLLRVRDAWAGWGNARRRPSDQFAQAVQVASGFLPKSLTDSPYFGNDRIIFHGSISHQFMGSANGICIPIYTCYSPVVWRLSHGRLFFERMKGKWGKLRAES
jgi:hypothetical protein